MWRGGSPAVATGPVAEEPEELPSLPEITSGGNPVLPELPPPPLDGYSLTPDMLPPPLDPPPPLPKVNPSAEPEVDPAPRLSIRFTGDSRFGVTIAPGGSDDSSNNGKRLTYSPDGATNNTCLMVDYHEVLFGGTHGRTLRRNCDGEGPYEAVWEYRGIQVTQTIKLAPGDVSRRMDMLQIAYQLENSSQQSHSVGLRAVMLDTLIGNNDGVPFIVPGSENIVTEPATYRREEIPAFVRLGTRRPGESRCGGQHRLAPREGERPGEVVLSHWPGGAAGWKYDCTPPLANDSAIGLYYKPQRLAAGKTRAFSFTYGLGSISSMQTKNPRLSLTAGGPFRAGSKFWLVALIQNPRAEQTVPLMLPNGVSLGDGETPSKRVTAGSGYSQLSWLLQLAPACPHDVEVKACLDPGGTEEKQVLRIEGPKPRLLLVAKKSVPAGKSLWLTAVVQNPHAGRTRWDVLPEGISLKKDEQPVKPVGDSTNPAQVSWLVQNRAHSPWRQGSQGPAGTGCRREQAHASSGSAHNPVDADRQGTGSGREGLLGHGSRTTRSERAAGAVTLSEGLSLGEHEQAAKVIEADASLVQLAWLARSAAALRGDVECRHAGTGSSRAQASLRVERPSSRLIVVAKDTAQAGKSFWVVAGPVPPAGTVGDHCPSAWLGPGPKRV